MQQVATVDRGGGVGGGAGAASRIVRHWAVPFLGAATLTVASHLLLKGGVLAQAARPFAGWFGTWAQPLVLSGLVLYALGMICWMMTVSMKDVSFLYPLTSVNYALVVAGSALFFGESISMRRALGVAVVMAGVALMNASSARGQSCTRS